MITQQELGTLLSYLWAAEHLGRNTSAPHTRPRCQQFLWEVKSNFGVTKDHVCQCLHPSINLISYFILSWVSKCLQAMISACLLQNVTTALPGNPASEPIPWAFTGTSLGASDPAFTQELQHPGPCQGLPPVMEVTLWPSPSLFPRAC